MSKRILPPRLLLAIANSSQPKRQLDALHHEFRRISNAVKGILEIEPLVSVQRDDLKESFRIFKSDIQLFHFAGHASGEGIETQEEEEDVERRITLAKGLAQLIGNYMPKEESEDQHKGLKFVFLNGCATAKQIDYFHKAGVKTVIATKFPIPDNYAAGFAEDFYKNLASGSTLAEAFYQAKSQIGLPKPSDDPRGFVRNGENGFPYIISFLDNDATHGEATALDWQFEIESEKTFKDGIIPPNVTLLCDRNNQTDEFDVQFCKYYASPEKPQFFFIHGKSNDLPGSLTDRFTELTIFDICERETKRKLPKKDRYMLYIPLPKKRDFEKKQEDIGLMVLKANFGKEKVLVQNGGQDVVKQLAKNRKFLIIHHSILSTEWHPRFELFLQTYIEHFWDIKLAESDPRVLIIFEIEYSPYKQHILGKFFKNNPANSLQGYIEKLEGQSPQIKVLEKLHLVDRSDLVDWHKKYLKKDYQLVDEIFGDEDQRPMKAILPILNERIQHHNDRLS